MEQSKAHLQLLNAALQAQSVAQEKPLGAEAVSLQEGQTSLCGFLCSSWKHLPLLEAVDRVSL